jgi:hypothetical protein
VSGSSGGEVLYKERGFDRERWTRQPEEIVCGRDIASAEHSSVRDVTKT